MEKTELTLTLTQAQWVFTVGPLNTARMIITQRLDGPFANGEQKGYGYYYSSMEAYGQDGTWKHIGGSATAHRSYEEAYKMLPTTLKMFRIFVI